MTRLEKLISIKSEVSTIRNNPVVVRGIQELNTIKVQASAIRSLFNAISEEKKDKMVETLIDKKNALINEVQVVSNLS